MAGNGSPIAMKVNSANQLDWCANCASLRSDLATAHALVEALEGEKKRLIDWLRWMDRASGPLSGCETCPAMLDKTCVDDWETCEVKTAEARAYLAALPNAAGEEGGGDG